MKVMSFRKFCFLENQNEKKNFFKIQNLYKFWSPKIFQNLKIWIQKLQKSFQIQKFQKSFKTKKFQKLY